MRRLQRVQGMDEHGKPEFLGRGEERIEAALAEIATVDVAADLDALQAKALLDQA